MAIAAHGERGRNAAGRAGVTLCYAECCKDVTTVGLGLQAGGAEPRGLAREFWRLTAWLPASLWLLSKGLLLSLSICSSCRALPVL